MREVPSGTRISAFIKGTPESLLDPYTMRGHIEKVLAVSQKVVGWGGAFTRRQPCCNLGHLASKL